MRSACIGVAVVAGCVDVPVAEEATGSGGATTGMSSGEAPGSDDTTGADDRACTPGEARECFTGPPGTQPVAPCAAGSQTCRANGAWGGCHGSLLPTRQDCTTPADETCSGAGPACQGAPAWLRAFTLTDTAQFDEAIAASALAIAPDGDIVATGTYQGTLTIAGDSHEAISHADIWVARFTSVGVPRWFRRFGGDPEPNHGYLGAPWSNGNIAFAMNGDIVLTANCIRTVDFGDGPLAGEDLDPVLLRLTATGQMKWARRFLGFHDYGDLTPQLLVAVRSDGGLWLVGTLSEGGVDLGGGPLLSSGWGDVLLARFDADGAHVWSRHYGDAGHQDVQGIALAPDDGLVLTGTLEGTLDLGLGPMPSAGTADAWVARVDAEGAAIWQRRYGDRFAQSGVGVQVDDDGGVVLAGIFQSAIDLGGGPLMGAVGQSQWDPAPVHYTAPFVARLDADGGHVWSRAFVDAAGSATPTSLARGADGTLVLTGYGNIDPSFPGDVWPGQAGGRSWIVALAGDGTPRWLQPVGGEPWAAATDLGPVIAAWGIGTAIEFADVSLGTTDLSSLVLGSFGT